MEKGKHTAAVTRSLQKLNLNPNSNKPKFPYNNITTSPVFSLKKPKRPPSLINLCLGVISEHLEDIFQDLGDTVSEFPSDIKKAMAAIARRKMLLNDKIIVALADSTWDILDLSGSDVSDVGLSNIVKMCKHLRAVDISQCSKITVLGVSELIKCRSLEIIRCGGCRQSDYTARKCLSLLRINLDIGEKESWEDLDTEEISSGVPSLRWFIWPNIDHDLLETWSAEFPRIILNPKPSSFSYKGMKIPKEAVSEIELDYAFVDGIDPKTWAAVTKFNATSTSTTGSGAEELSMAEKFRLAFVERDMKSAPKRAKNARQHQRRAKREWVMADTTARSLFLAAKATKSLNSLN